MNDEKVTVLCLEDEADLLEELTEELVALGYFALGAANVTEAERCLRDHPPDIILCDILMPGRSGLAFLKDVRQNHPDLDTTPFIFLTALSDHEHQVLGRKAGADDYLVKPVDLEILDATIRAKLQTVARFAARYPHPQRHGQEVHLSRRETEVLRLLGRGRTIGQAAADLGLSEYTVGDYVKSIYRKLGISNRVEAAREAMRRQL